MDDFPSRRFYFERILLVDIFTVGIFSVVFFKFFTMDVIS